MQIVQVHSVSGSVYSASQFRFKLRTDTRLLYTLPILHHSTHADLRPTRCSARTVDLSTPPKHSLISPDLFSTQNSCSTCTLSILYHSTHTDLRPTRCSVHTVDLSTLSKLSLISPDLFSTQTSCSTCTLPILYHSTHPDLRPTRCSAHTVDLSILPNTL